MFNDLDLVGVLTIIMLPVLVLSFCYVMSRVADAWMLGKLDKIEKEVEERFKSYRK